MRRLLALLLLTSPSAALSQAAGQIFFGGSITSPVINAAQCAVSNTSDSLSLTWTISLENSATWPFVNAGRYQVFAASADQGIANPFCYTANGATWTAGPVTTSPATPVATLASSSATVLKSALASSAGFNCTVDTTINVCVLWFRSTDSGDTTPRGFAKGTVQLKVVPPDAPVVDTVQPGGESLTIWVKTPATMTSTVVASTFRARAVGPDSVEHFSDSVAASGTTPVRARIDGLVDGVPYTVTAFASSAEGNQSVVSDCYRLPAGAASCTTVAPRPVQDAWEFYKAADGRDSGGCDAGPAGIVALLGAVTLLRIRRRA
jgi:hypothetical protein